MPRAPQPPPPPPSPTTTTRGARRVFGSRSAARSVPANSVRTGAAALSSPPPPTQSPSSPSDGDSLLCGSPLYAAPTPPPPRPVSAASSTSTLVDDPYLPMGVRRLHDDESDGDDDYNHDGDDVGHLGRGDDGNTGDNDYNDDDAGRIHLPRGTGSSTGVAPGPSSASHRPTSPVCSSTSLPSKIRLPPRYLSSAASTSVHSQFSPSVGAAGDRHSPRPAPVGGPHLRTQPSRVHARRSMSTPTGATSIAGTLRAAPHPVAAESGTKDSTAGPHRAASATSPKPHTASLPQAKVDAQTNGKLPSSSSGAASSAENDGKGVVAVVDDLAWRRIVDLEISNESLFAVNETLEKTIREQAGALFLLRREVASLRSELDSRPPPSPAIVTKTPPRLPPSGARPPFNRQGEQLDRCVQCGRLNGGLAAIVEECSDDPPPATTAKSPDAAEAESIYRRVCAMVDMMIKDCSRAVTAAAPAAATSDVPAAATRRQTRLPRPSRRGSAILGDDEAAVAPLEPLGELEEAAAGPRETKEIVERNEAAEHVDMSVGARPAADTLVASPVSVTARTDRMNDADSPPMPTTMAAAAEAWKEEPQVRRPVSVLSLPRLLWSAVTAAAAAAAGTKTKAPSGRLDRKIDDTRVDGSGERGPTAAAAGACVLLAACAAAAVPGACARVCLERAFPPLLSVVAF
ncbi:hypothetical protein HK405_003966 [Cladochytrium tenue]|nr:hypothetical protein HK405_003966 [Cladochytrium tenue]